MTFLKVGQEQIFVLTKLFITWARPGGYKLRSGSTHLQMKSFLPINIVMCHQSVTF